ncbi:PorV/PorQ family protein [bacterium]
MKQNQNLLFIIICIICLSTVCFADTPTAQFLLVGQGARAEAMGQSVVANCFDYSAVYWNPSALPYLKQGQAGFVNTKFPTDIEHNFFSITYPYKHFGFGFHILSHNTHMTFYDNLDNEISSGKGEQSLYYSSAFSYRISQFFSLGCSLGHTSMQLHNNFGDNYESKAMYMNLSGLYRHNRLSIGFSGYTGGKLSFENDEKQPDIFRVGGAFEFLKKRNFLTCLSYTRDFDDENAEAVGLGIEYTQFDKIIMRGGYNYKKRGPGTPSLGIGIKFKKFNFDYAFTPKLASLETMSFHRMGITFKFGELRSTEYKVETQAPEIVLQYLKNDKNTLEPKDHLLFTQFVNIIGTASSDKDVLLDTLLIICNGKSIIKKTGIGLQKYIFNEQIKLKEGINTLQVTAIDTSQIMTKSKKIVITYERNILKGDSTIEDFIDYVSTKGKNLAVLIGAAEYPENSGFHRLDYVANDIGLFKKELINSLKNFDQERIYTLGKETWCIDDKCNYAGEATKQNIEAFLGDELPEKVSKDDRVLIFFSGHGITLDTIKENKKQGYLAPIDGNKKEPFSTCISMDMINQLSERIPAKQILFIVDACNSGLVLIRNKGYGRKKDFKKRIESFLTDSRQAMTAGQSTQSSQISSEHQQSIYTHYLIEGLKGRADNNKDGVISVHELHIYVRNKVTDTTDNYQIPQMGRLKDGGEGDFFFVLNK